MFDSLLFTIVRIWQHIQWGVWGVSIVHSSITSISVGWSSGWGVSIIINTSQQCSYCGETAECTMDYFATMFIFPTDCITLELLLFTSIYVYFFCCKFAVLTCSSFTFESMWISFTCHECLTVYVHVCVYLYPHVLVGSLILDGFNSWFNWEVDNSWCFGTWWVYKMLITGLLLLTSCTSFTVSLPF